MSAATKRVTTKSFCTGRRFLTFVTTRSRPESFRRSVRREEREVRPRKRDSFVEPLDEAEAAEAEEGVMEEERLDMRVKARTLLVKRERGDGRSASRNETLCALPTHELRRLTS